MDLLKLEDTLLNYIRKQFLLVSMNIYILYIYIYIFFLLSYKQMVQLAIQHCISRNTN